MSAGGCPSWCDSPGACHGYHSAGTSVTYIPALVDLPKFSDPTAGAVFPVVAAFPNRDDQEGLPPGVSLHIAGPEQDAQVGLLPSHARALVAQMQTALDMLEKG